MIRFNSRQKCRQRRASAEIFPFPSSDQPKVNALPMKVDTQLRLQAMVGEELGAFLSFDARERFQRQVTK